MRSDDLGKLLLRLTLGVLILLHGIAKIGSGPERIAGMLRQNDLPGGLAWLVYIGEVLAPLLLIVGVWTRAAAAVVAINMLVAIWLAHRGQIGQLSANGGWAIELQGLFLAVAVALMMLGAGRFSIGGSGRWN